jgi:hypothetical protein
MPFIQDPTGMAALGLPLGVVGAAVGGWIIESNAMLRFTTTIVGAAAAVLGLIALVTENVLELATREELLIAFVASVVVLWLTAVGEHSGLHLGRRPTGAPRVHA